MGDLDLRVSEGWLRRGWRPINPKTLTVEASETVRTTTVEPATAYRQTYGSTAEKVLLQWSDFEYLGAYTTDLAGSNYGLNPAYPAGFTLRRVAGETYPRLYLTSTGGTGGILEFQPTGEPSLTTTPAVAPTLTGWNANAVRPSVGNTEWLPHGVYWDADTQRLYFGLQPRGGYDSADVAHFGYVTLTTDRPSVLSKAGDGTDIWEVIQYMNASMPDSSCNDGRVVWGCTGIPEWFASAYTGGKRMAIGFGGAWSQTASTHHGLAMFAIDHLDLIRDKVYPYTNPYAAPGTHFWKYGGTATSLSAHPYAHDNTAWQAKFGPDFYEWQAGGQNDLIAANPTKNYRSQWHGQQKHTNVCWVDLPTKHGILAGGVDCESNWYWRTLPDPGIAHLDGNHAQWSKTLRIREGGCLGTPEVNGTGIAVGDMLAIHTDYNGLGTSPTVGDPTTYPGARHGGNGIFVDPPYVGAPGIYPWGEQVRVTAVIDDSTITVTHTDGQGANYGDYGLFGFGCDGAAVRMGLSYFDAVGPSCRRASGLYCWDPRTFAEVAQGTRAATNTDWAWYQDQPLAPRVARTAKGGNASFTGGYLHWAFDATTKRLYGLKEMFTVAEGGFASTYVKPWYACSLVVVFQIHE